MTNGASARGLFARIQRARTFLPVPLSPLKRSTASDAAARAVGLQESKKGRAARLKERRLPAFVQFFLQLRQATPEALGLDHAMSGQPDLIGRERLGNVVDRATPDRVDGAFDGGVRGDDDHAHIRLTRQDLGKQLEAGIGTQPQIQKHHVEVPAVQGLERGATRRDAQHARTGSLQAEPQ